MCIGFWKNYCEGVCCFSFQGKRRRFCVKSHERPRWAVKDYLYLSVIVPTAGGVGYLLTGCLRWLIHGSELDYEQSAKIHFYHKFSDIRGDLYKVK